MKLEATKRFNFEAAHTLPNHDGKCRNVHGHSYVLEITITGNVQTSGSKEGMIMDFSDLTKIVETEIISKWDHVFLNDLLPFTTTVENLALEVARILKDKLPLSRVKLFETAKCFAEVTL